MNQRFYMLLLFWAIFVVQGFGQTTITIQDGDLVGNTTYNWTKDNIYVLDGLVYLEDGGVLNIEAGTVIKGASVVTTGDNTSALIIARGAQIFAEGTADEPIIFTAEIDDPADPNDVVDPQEAQGLWGGVLILGKATIARPNGEDGIEGIDANETRAKFGGGTNPNDADNSGTLRYVSIRHGGAALSPGDEINGLSLGGVGSGTILEYIEIFANFDDGIEFFGGTVDLKYAVTAFCGDDGFDYDFGWRGRGQFWFSIQDDGPASAGRAGEHDGANPDGLDPFSQPTIYNATYIGSGASSAEAPIGEGNDFALLFRDRAGGFYWNSIFTDFYGKALTIEDLPDDNNDTYTNFVNGDLAFKDNVWFGFGAGTDLADLVQLGEGNTTGDVSTLVSTLVTDGNTLADPALAGISRSPDGGLDPRLNDGSPALTATNLPTDAFFTPVAYKGAFGNGDNWLLSWTALDADGFLGDLVTPVQSQTIRITDADLVANTTYTWTAENTYILDGLVYLEAGGKLNIEPGTVIKGAAAVTTGDNTSALIIARDAQIFAQGTAENPIIFTSEIDDPTDPNDVADPQEAQGLWGGVLILGNATIARPNGEDGIEGIDANEERAKFGGGASPNDADNSGILRYVSIRHGGAALSPGDEINGLSLGGVGSGTTLEYIEIFANFDDGIEFFGGTVDLKYAVTAFCGDDGFDYDFGWKGRGQFWFSIQDDGPASAGRAGEHDGANPDGLDPFSQPTIYNATYIGSGADSAEAPEGEGNDFALLFRDRAGGFYWNSIFTDFYGKALTIEDLPDDNNDTYTNFVNGDLAFKDNVWFGFGAGTDLADLVQLGEGNTTGDVSTLVSTLVTDGNTLTDPALAGISRSPDGGLDPRLNDGSPALTADNLPTDAFFTPVAYKGAFGNGDNWLLSWTALDADGFLGDLVTPVQGQTFRIKDEDLVANTTYTWTAENTYILDGLVYLEAGGKLNIEAGTVIKGATEVTTGDNTSALIIARDAQIFAQGTADNPVIFTAEIDDPFDGSDVFDPQEAQGLWGGLLILGNATIARPNGIDGIEGIDANEERAKFGGGDNPNDEDNSGILRYVSIRHGGAALSPGDEINGLSLGGVGSGTTLEYIEIFANFDDGIEFFGGTVDLKYAVAAFCGDDGFDYDFGWKGRGQFWFVIQDDGPASAGRAGEHDGANPDGLDPFSQPIISNATYIGSGAASVDAPDGEVNDFALLFRDRAGGFYSNSIFTDFYGKALTIEDLPDDDNDTYANFLAGDLALTNNIWFGFGAGADLTSLVQLGEGNTTGDVSALVTTLATDGNTLSDPLLGGISRTTDNGLDPRPAAGSPARGTGVTPDDEFFTTVDYMGAFDPDANLWLLKWTALDVDNFLGDIVSSTYERVKEEQGVTFEAPVPTPAHDWATIKMSLVDATKVNMYIVDLTGRVIRREMNNQFFGAGDHQHTIDVSRLATGTYFVVLQAGRNQIAHKLIIAR